MHEACMIVGVLALVMIGAALARDMVPEGKMTKDPYEISNGSEDEETLINHLTAEKQVGSKIFQPQTKEEIQKIKETLKKINQILCKKYNTPCSDEEPSILVGDVIYTLEQAEHQLAMIQAENSNATKRDILDFTKNDWTRGLAWPNAVIYYTMANSTLTDKAKREIDKAIAFYESKTCLDFRYFDVRSNPPSQSQNKYLYFQGTHGACYSHIGRRYTGQVVNIHAYCTAPGYVQHEIGHAIGLYHEQNRQDRDRHVKVHFSNIQSAYRFAYSKCSDCMVTPDFPYDFGSVMHYTSMAFAVDRSKPTMTAYNRDYQKTMGQTYGGASYLDIKQINTIYCSSQVKANPCARSRTKCHNGGYPNPADCSVCICPDMYEGDCSKRFNEFKCGADLVASEEKQYFSRPNISEISRHHKCVWKITTRPGTELKYGFEKLKLHNGHQCEQEFVEVRDRDFENTGPRFCGTDIPSSRIVPGTHVEVMYKTQYKGPTAGDGFTVFYYHIAPPANCTFINFIDTSFLDGGSTTSCNSQSSCLIHSGTNALLSSCSPLLLRSRSNRAGTTLTPDPGNSNGGKILLSCSAGGVLTASGFAGGTEVAGVILVQQTAACCPVNEIALYSNTVTVTLSPQTPVDGRVHGATVSNCYKVEKILHMRSVEEVCEGVHRLKTVTNNIQVECMGFPGKPGTWAHFPGCIPLSGPGGNAVCTPVQEVDRAGGGIVPPSPIYGISSPEECAERCRNHETGSAVNGKFGCVAFGYLDNSSPFLKSTCWLKEIVGNPSHPFFRSLVPHMWSGVFEGTIQCNSGTTLPCKKWCDGVTDCPDGDDELGCPEPCNTVHTAANNACGSALIGGLPPVEGGKYFQCSPGQCVPCSSVCEKQLFGSGGTKHCPTGLDEANTTCIST